MDRLSFSNYRRLRATHLADEEALPWCAQRLRWRDTGVALRRVR